MENKCCAKCVFDDEYNPKGCTNIHCECHTRMEAGEKPFDGAGGMTFDNLVRDLTKVHPQPKSYVRELLSQYLLHLQQQAHERMEREIGTTEDKWDMGYHTGIRKAQEIIKEVFK